MVDLDRMKALEQAATPADQLEHQRYDHGGGRTFRHDRDSTDRTSLVADWYELGDREFYIAARTFVPEAIAEVARLRAEVAAARVEGLREAIPLCCGACADPTDQPDAGMVHNNNLLCDARHIRARIAELEETDG